MTNEEAAQFLLICGALYSSLYVATKLRQRKYRKQLAAELAKRSLDNEKFKMALEMTTTRGSKNQKLNSDFWLIVTHPDNW